MRLEFAHLSRQNEILCRKIYHQGGTKYLLEVLVKHPEGISLKDLKICLSAGRELDRMVEMLVSQGWIKRQDRLYFLSLPQLEGKSFAKAEPDGQKLWQELKSIKDDLILEDPFLFMELKKKTVFSKVPMIVSDDFAILLASLPAPLTMMENNHFFHTAFTNHEQQEQTLYHYFVATAADTYGNQPFTKEIYQLIGDVNPDYVLDRLGLFLLKSTAKAPQNDIFFTLLTRLGLDHLEVLPAPNADAFNALANALIPVSEKIGEISYEVFLQMLLAYQAEMALSQSVAWYVKKS